MRRALITGLSGPTLLSDEARFLQATRPAGIILFARNCVGLDQIRTLVADAHAAVGSADLLVLIDQEGGRVRRLRPPLWRALPSAAAYDFLWKADAALGLEAAHAVARLTAEELRDIGVNTTCAPVLDLRIEGAHDIIGDRAYGAEPTSVAALGRAVAEGYSAGGVVPVIKHIPGHGRALADSHLELPVVATARSELDATDFAPFRRLADQPAAMTAHVVFTSVDAARPASTSAIVTRDVIRGFMGFDGLLMSDDLSMQALSGSLAERAEAVIAAGSDVALHCNGNLDEMRQVAAAVPVVAASCADRLERCFAVPRTTQPYDRSRAEVCWQAALAADTARHSPPAAESV